MVVQHVSSDLASILIKIIRRSTRLVAKEVADGVAPSLLLAICFVTCCRRRTLLAQRVPTTSMSTRLSG
jgi:hypothetical protein